MAYYREANAKRLYHAKDGWSRVVGFRFNDNRGLDATLRNLPDFDQREHVAQHATNDELEVYRWEAPPIVD